MSQVSKKPLSLPLRKRLRPTVNLNVAGRRRNNARDITSLTDGNSCVTDESSTNIEDSCGSLSLSQDASCSPTKGVHCDNTFNPEDKLLDSSFESKVSVKSDASTVIIRNELLLLGDNGNNEPNQNKSIDSTASTVVLTSCFENVSGILNKVRSKSLNHSFESNRSISSISTIILNENDFGGTKCPGRENPEDVREKASISVDTPSSNVISNSKHPENVSDENQLEGKSISVINNVRAGNLINDAISLTLDKDNGYTSNSVSARTSPVPDLNCSNTDCESLLEDDTSSVLSYRSGCAMLPPKWRRRQSSRSTRLHVARKEFEAKYLNTKPERSSLRMLDLIYYNPTSNPMKSSPDSNQGVVVSSNESNDVAEKEEDADDPDEPDNGDDENNRVPAPRVKVGPNGELVLDEQSLVIETTQSKKSRKEIANLTVVVDSGSNTTYHTYSKKKKRRNDWGVQETVRFYKALQSIGTDFSLMQSLFPSRSRVDLKTKYKREEKINGHLVEKALRFPSLFDLSELEKEEDPVQIQMRVNENKEREKCRKKVKKFRKKSLDSVGFDDGDKSRSQNKRKKKTQTSKIKTLSQRNGGNEVSQEVRGEGNTDDCSDDEYQPIKRVLPAKKAKVLENANTRPKRVSDDNRPNYAAIENGDAYFESALNLLDNSRSDVEELVEELQDDNISAEEEYVEEASQGPVIENALNDLPISLEGLSMTNVQPGSIVLLTTQCPHNPEYQICNVFMVQDNSTGLNHQSGMSSNTNNSLTFNEQTSSEQTSSEINSSNVNSAEETQPS